MAAPKTHAARSSKHKARKTASRKLKAALAAKKKQVATKELVLTLGAQRGGVVKIEKLEKGGRRKLISAHEFALLTDDMGGLRGVVEHAYVAGVSDALDDDFAGLRRAVLREVKVSRKPAQT